MHERALIIGLDCAAPQLVFDRWRNELPALAELMERGAFGVLRSCDPPITVPAWSCMASSRSPGALGIYGFRNRADHSYDRMQLADSRAVHEPRVWDLVSQAGRPVVVVGVPGTYPPNPVNGVMVSCFMTPDVERSQYTFPREIKHEAERLVGRYIVDVDDYRTENKAHLLAQLHEMTDKRFRLAEHLLQSRPWDLFFMVEIGTDRIHHGFWRHLDAEHRFHVTDSPFAGAVLDYYRELDARLGRLLTLVGDDCAILVVSDHGAQRADGGICVNEWLRENGYLTLTHEPESPMALTPELVDWDRTVAWGEGGYYCRLFLNVEGREPRGTVPAADYARVREELKVALEQIGDEHGWPTGTVAHRPEDLYGERRGVAPDLLVYFGALRWRSIGLVGTGNTHVFANDTGPDDANHAPEGLYIAAGEGIEPGPGPERSILDVAPTVLRLLGEPIPAEMEGATWVGSAVRC
jgi:predicted AlkP superfamily phosphohydrolase/phosphomutase